MPTRLIRLYSIRDVKTDSYEPPFGSTNDETAKRYFQRILQQIPTMRENPQDFTLHGVGVINDSSGLLQAHASVQFIASGLDCVKPITQGETHGTAQQTLKKRDETPIQPSTKG